VLVQHAPLTMVDISIIRRKYVLAKHVTNCIVGHVQSIKT
jgi:hypothetical protein